MAMIFDGGSREIAVTPCANISEEIYSNYPIDVLKERAKKRNGDPFSERNSHK